MKRRQKTLDGKILPEPYILSELEKYIPLVKEQGYKKISIPKTRGGWRELCIPSPELKKVQKRIVGLLQKMYFPRYRIAFGLYKGNDSHIAHAKLHANQRFILKLDLKDAFSSITYRKLRPVLTNTIYQHMALRYERYDPDLIFSYLPADTDMQMIWANTLSEIILKLTTYEGKLPQGAPSSPLLFYIFLSQKISDIYWLAFKELRKPKRTEWQISFYVDNIVISTKNKWISPQIIRNIEQSIELIGLPVNLKKTKMYDCKYGAAMITGLTVDGKGNVALPKTKREAIRAMINNACYIPYDPKLNAKIEGTIAYIKQIYEGQIIPGRIQKPYNKYRKTDIYKKWLWL